MVYIKLILNPAYIDYTIQRISTKYRCLQDNNQYLLQHFTRISENLNFSTSNELFATQKKASNVPSSQNKADKFIEWPQISTIIISPKNKSQLSQKTKKIVITKK